jgi:glyoxylase-like metal-dependent hydrolase (beta-lactamase superfamily II)
LKDNILPIQESGQLRYVEDRDGFEFHEGISIRFAFGHTDAMMLPQIQYKGKTIIYMADLLPSTGHIPLPYVMSYDMFPLQTLREKKSFLQEAADKQYILYLEHDPLNECCTIVQTEKGVRLGDAFSLQSLF